jgi:hypothetical protein
MLFGLETYITHHEKILSIELKQFISNNHQAEKLFTY